MADRNPKVRRRLAAGKLRLRLCDLRNLGPQAERQLALAGIHSVEALRRMGALEAYLAVRRLGNLRSLNLLWALVGALEPWPEGRDWREVAASEARLPLMLAVEARDAARREVIEAAGGRSAAPRRKPASDEHSGAAVEPAWVPGLPFETPRAKKKKNRR